MGDGWQGGGDWREKRGGDGGRAGVASGAFRTLSLNPFASCRAERFPRTESGHLIERVRVYKWICACACVCACVAAFRM